MRRPLSFALALSFAALVACSPREEAPEQPDDPYPPNDLTALRQIYEKELNAMGLTLVRGALIDRGEGRYDRSDTGTHLALYVEPARTISTARYVENIAPLTRLFASDVFERWSKLETFDICQEPVVHEGDEPRPVTQVELSRRNAASFDWETAGLPDLIRGATEDPPRVTMFLATRILKSDGYERAVRAASKKA